MLTLGIDEAGRGPLIGPMVISGVLLTNEQESILKKNNVRDSKILYHSIRIKLSKLIKENSLSYKIIKILPSEIDDAIKTKKNLNKLEAQKVAEIINSLNSGKFIKEKIKVVVDCPSTNINSWKNMLMKHIMILGNLTIICEHKADVNHVAVSAASILAKVTREDEISKLKKVYGEFGSGYPSDPTTQNFLKNYGKDLKDSGIFRKSWLTWRNHFQKKEQRSLKDFS